MQNHANKIINHLAIIMDGNSRWAKQNNLTSYVGHKKGAENVKKVIEFAINHKIKHLSLFAFSTENWQRPKEEVDYLLELLDLYLTQEIQNLIKNKIKLSVIGDTNKLSSGLQSKIATISEMAIDDIVLNLYITFSYGGRQEIIDAVKKALVSNIDHKILNTDNFKQFLYDPLMPDIDLIIRTGGNKRISNFLLWHCAYAELYFIDKYWPDFDLIDFNAAITDYNQRLRTFGIR